MTAVLRNVTMIAAVARNGVIGDGRDHAVAPLRGPQVLQADDDGPPVVMGRRTFDSIGRRCRAAAASS